MTTNYTNPTPAQREALATNQGFIFFVYVGLANYAYTHYTEAGSNPDSQFNVWLTQALMNQAPGSIGTLTWRETMARAIAYHQAAPAEWFALTDDFSSIDPDTMDNLIDTAWKPAVGFTNYNE